MINASITAIEALNDKEKMHCGLSKRQMFGWRSDSDKGEFMWISKHALIVDKRYQRENLNRQRVRSIARDWSWPAFGVVLVFKRLVDGLFYVYDGQHRVEAARIRDDVGKLPCFVFEGRDIQQEAGAFVAANTVRGPMKAVERYKARVVSEDPQALAIDAVLEEWGYSVNANRGKYQVACISAIEAAYARHEERFRRVIYVAMILADGRSFDGDLVLQLEYVDEHMCRCECGDILRDDILEKIRSIGYEKCLDIGRRYKHLISKGGRKAMAAGLLNEINSGKRSKSIPPIYGH